jgi:hypothetical protein
METKPHDPSDWQGRREDQVKYAQALAFWTMIAAGVLTCGYLLIKLFS